MNDTWSSKFQNSTYAHTDQTGGAYDQKLYMITGHNPGYKLRNFSIYGQTCVQRPPLHSALPGGQFHLGSKNFNHFLFYFMFTDTLTRRNPKYIS